MSEAGKVFMFGFTEEILSGERLAFFKSAGVRNFILFGRNLARLKENIEIIKNEFENPLIAIDQEGGIVRRIKDTDDFFFGNMNAAMSNSASFIRDVYFATGKILREKGINLNLAPVADVYLKKGNSIGTRSFGSDPQKVSLFVNSAIKGLHDAGILSALKHFVGYGGAVKDPHKGLPEFGGNSEMLEKALYPFKTASANADFAMTAHITVGEIDQENPVTFSKKAISVLRSEIGFKGPVITDCLEMGGAMVYPASEIALKALNAGNDLLIVSHTLSLQKEMLKSVEKSGIDLSEHLERLGHLKLRKENPKTLRVKKKFVCVYKDNGFIPKEGFHFLFPQIVQEVQVEEMKVQQGDFPIDPSSEETERISTFPLKNAVLVSYNAFKHRGQIALAKRIKEKNKKLCVIVAGDPADVKEFSFADCILLTFSPLEKIIKHALSVIEGKEKAEGILPVSEEIIWKE